MYPLLIALLISSSACKKKELEENIQEDAQWSLFWSDEFNGNSVDTAVWQISDTPKSITSRTGRPENLRIENGVLIMELHQEQHNGMAFTGSEISTRGAKLYGKYECRARLPSASRAWSAFWMLGDFGEYGPWPACGEVDILEYWGYNDPTLHTNLHTQHSNWTNTVDRPAHSTAYILPDARDEFHLYAMEWYPDHMNFLVDGQPYWTYTKLDDGWEKWPFDRPMHVLFMLYAAPDWNGSDADLPAQFEIDYVRVYDRVE